MEIEIREIPNGSSGRAFPGRFLSYYPMISSSSSRSPLRMMMGRCVGLRSEETGEEWKREERVRST